MVTHSLLDFNTELLSLERCWQGTKILRGCGGGGGGGERKGEGGLYLTLHCRHRNDCCIMMGSDERHLNASLIVRGKVVR